MKILNFLNNNIVKNIVIFLPLSRPDKLTFQANQIARLIKSDGYTYSILVVVDHPRIYQQTVEAAFDRKEFKKIPLIVRFTELPQIASYDVDKRRERITQVFALAQNTLKDPKAHYKADFIFTIEDDTVIEVNALKNLLETYWLMSEKYKVGFISGLQAGRWGVKMIGAWRCDDPVNPTELWTIDNHSILVTESIDAAGFYCFLTTGKLFKKVPLKFGAFGPDVYFGLFLSAQGLRNFVDWTVRTRHMSDTGLIEVDDFCVQVRYKLVDGEWKLQK